MDTKRYTMLKTVTGSRDGLRVETFSKGETYDLDGSLAEQFYHQAAVEEAAAPEASGQPADARARSTKVTGPAETKVVAPADSKEGEAGVDLGTQHIEELVALARDHYGLEVDTTMPEEVVRKMIEAAEADEGGEAEPDDKPATKKAKK